MAHTAPMYVAGKPITEAIAPICVQLTAESLQVVEQSMSRASIIKMHRRYFTRPRPHPPIPGEPENVPGIGNSQGRVKNKAGQTKMSRNSTEEGTSMSELPAKPVIFFSHSTKDEAYLRRLKELFVERTNGMIDVFLSCDGESIRYGSNWSYKIEEEAKNCRLMFAFLSPHSITSKWLYFETAFALASGKEVVPIGIHGVSPGDVGPPLSLLHGFRLHSTDTLNNLFVVINQHFGSKYDPVFKAEDYESLAKTAFASTSGPFGELNPLIEHVSVDFTDTIFATANNDQLEAGFRKIADVLSSLNIKSNYKSNALTSLGMRAYVLNGGTIRFVAAPASLGTTFPQLVEVVRRFDRENPKPFAVKVAFESNVGLVEAPEQITGRLLPLGIELETNGWYSLENVVFWGRNYNSVKIEGGDLALKRKDGNELTLADVVNIVRIYWTHGLLFTAE
jgi:TIR domain-containing protein